MTFYEFSLLDPRLTEDAKRYNEEVFRNEVFGIEVTIPALSDRCIFNIDPQHGYVRSDRAAVQDAVLYNPLPPKGTTLVTIKADLDSIGSMAVLDCRACGTSLKGASGRISLITKIDRFERGDWPGIREFPTSEVLWTDADKWMRTSTPIAMYVGDNSIPLQERVVAMQKWFLDFEDPRGYRERAVEERQALARSIESGDIVWKMYGGIQNGKKICFVRTTHRSATSVGYCRAPVVVALNRHFPVISGTIRKFTICAYREKYADIVGAVEELNSMEPGWGGSHTIGGSPQDRSSELKVKEVVSVVMNHLR